MATPPVSSLRRPSNADAPVKTGTAPLLFPSLFLLLLVLLMLPGSLPAQAPVISVLPVRGPINPATANYLRENIEAAGPRGDRLVLVEMDTPGGLDSSMRDTVQAIFTSAVPVVVYVTPSGARAASAGAVIAMAADVCAMAPGTTIGAAHPVSIGSQPDKVMGEKILNDAETYMQGLAQRRGRNAGVAGKMVRESIALTADRAFEEKVVDIVATDRQELLQKLEGRHIARGGGETVLRLAGAKAVTRAMGTRDKLLNTIGNPDIAYLLMLLGFLGLFFELSNPGVILPGVIGSISLILALFAFQTLPVNYAGALLILLALILFLAEVKIVSHGLLAVGGIVSMVLGSIMLFPSHEPYQRLSVGVILGTVLVTTLFFVVVIAKVIEAQRQKPVTGQEAMLGEKGVADTDIMLEGKVLVEGVHWNARSTAPICKGDKIEVVAVEGLRVVVKKVG